MKATKSKYKKLISVEDAPVTKKEKKKEKLGIVKSKTLRQNFQVTEADVEALDSIVETASKKLNFKFNKTKAFQVLVRGAAKHPAQFLKWAKS